MMREFTILTKTSISGWKRWRWRLSGKKREGVECNYLWNTDAVICVLGASPCLISFDVLVCVCVCVCVCISSHPHVCSLCLLCQNAACDCPRSRPLETSFYWAMVFGGVGDGLSCTERQRVAGMEETGGREAGWDWGVCACSTGGCVCKAARKIVPGRGWHGETLWIAKPVTSPWLWESDKTLPVLLPFFLLPFNPPSSVSLSHSGLLPLPLFAGLDLNFLAHLSFLYL